MDGHAGGLQQLVPALLEPPDCILRRRDPLNDDDDDRASARCAGNVPCADIAAMMVGRVDGPLELAGEILDGDR